MSKPLRITLTPAVSGDTWDGLYDCSFSSTGTAFASNLALVRMHFKDASGVAVMTLSSANPTDITITDAENWEFDILQRVMALSGGYHSFGIETTDSTGIVKTRVVGTIEIISDPV